MTKTDEEAQARYRWLCEKIDIDRLSIEEGKEFERASSAVTSIWFDKAQRSADDRALAMRMFFDVVLLLTDPAQTIPVRVREVLTHWTEIRSRMNGYAPVWDKDGLSDSAAMDEVRAFLLGITMVKLPLLPG